VVVDVSALADDAVAGAEAAQAEVSGRGRVFALRPPARRVYTSGHGLAVADWRRRRPRRVLAVAGGGGRRDGDRR